MPKLLPLLLLALLLAACGGDAEPETTAGPATEPIEAAETTSEPAEPRMEDGVQVVEVTVGPMGYEPAQIRLQAGVPARLVFTRTIEGECPSQIQIPAFEVPVTDLPMHEPVAIAFTPEEEGAFAFVCGMDMMRGTLLVQS